VSHSHTHTHDGPAAPCAIEGIATLIGEEHRLEAVAFEPRARKIAIATIGPQDDSIAKRVGGLLASSAKHCGDFNAQGACEVCDKQLVAHVPAALSGQVTVKKVLGNILIERHTCATAPRFWKWHDLRWPKLQNRQAADLHHHEEEDWRFLAVMAGICLVAAIGGFVMAIPALGLPAWASIAAYVLAYITGAWEAAQETWEKIKRFTFDIHFLMLSVAVGAAAVGAWKEGALLLVLFSASGAMEHYAEGRTRKEISALLKGAPKSAVLLNEGREREIPVDDLVVGMRVRIKPGAQIPADLRVHAGSSACDESTLTGESAPVEKSVGDELHAGTLNIWGVLDGDVLRPASESAYQKVIRLIETAQHLRAPAQKFTDLFGTRYTAGVLGLCAAMFFIWWLVFKLPPFAETPEGASSAFYRAMTLLVVMSPCALVLSVPSAFLAAIARGARSGVLFRGGAAIEGLAGVGVIAFDKTGTLTEGDLQIADFTVKTGDPLTAKTALFNLARFSDHPLSRSLTKWGLKEGLEEKPVTNFRQVAGKGAAGGIDGVEWIMGRWEYVAENNNPRPEEAPGIGDAEVWLRATGFLARALLRDRVRDSAAGLIKSLHSQGLRTVMLTGDRPVVAEAIAKQTGIASFEAGLLPEQKLAALQRLRKEMGGTIAMVGDGVNDAPGLAIADVGIAMGARGSDAALEQADIILMKDRLEQVVLARDLSVRATRIIRQNIGIALGTVILMGLTALGFPLPLAIGVAAHEGSTVLVVLNSLRLLRR